MEAEASRLRHDEFNRFYERANINLSVGKNDDATASLLNFFFFFLLNRSTFNE